MNTLDIPVLRLALCYLLLLFPLGIMLWFRIPMVQQTLVSLIRMTVQLIFVGMYLQIIFRLNNFWLNLAWLLVMISIADLSILRGCKLRVRKLLAPLFFSLLTGAAIPLALFLGPVLQRPQLLDAQYAIPIGGMILGNCLRADIIGVRNFFETLRLKEKSYLYSLGQGATLWEATRPYLRNALQAALAPTVATMATIGLVALPGMMTGVILGGASPMTAIKYQIAIMIAIFSGTAITVAMAIRLTTRTSFTGYGILKKEIFTGKR